MSIKHPKRLEQAGTGVLNIAHRGARAFAPENTLVAFEKAKMLGCPMFEIDIHCARDGELIVHHDDHLYRCTDVVEKFPGRSSYFLSDFTRDELSTLDAGSWYAEQIELPAGKRNYFLQDLSDLEITQFISPKELEYYRSGEIRLPTLKQTLELARDLGLMVNIELKMLPRMYPGMTDATIDLVESMGMAQEVLISSFDHEQLLRVRKRSQRIATAVLTGDRLANPGAYLNMLDADAYHPSRDSLGLCSVDQTLDRAGIANVRDHDCAINVWTCNDKAEMRRLIAAGVSGLISDYPNRVNEVLAELNINNT